MAKGTVNRVILLGRVGQSPELRQTQSGLNVVNVNLATTEIFKEETHTEWHKVIIFGKRAEIIHQYVQKGDSLYIEGRICTDKWQDATGKDIYRTKIICHAFQLIGNNRNKTNDYNNLTNVQSFNNDYAKAKGEKPKIPDFNEIVSTSDFDDDIPF